MNVRDTNTNPRSISCCCLWWINLLLLYLLVFLYTAMICELLDPDCRSPGDVKSAEGPGQVGPLDDADDVGGQAADVRQVLQRVQEASSGARCSAGST